MRAVDIMDTSIVSDQKYLTRQTTYRRISDVTRTSESSTFAVVDSEGISSLSFYFLHLYNSSFYS